MHKKIEHEGVRFKCPICSKYFKNFAHYNSHVKQHNSDSDTKAICLLCSRKCLNKRTLRTHMEVVHNKQAT